MRYRAFYKRVALVTTLAFFNLTLITHVSAGVIDTETYAQTVEKTDVANKKQLTDWLLRQEVAQQLNTLGVSPEKALERVNSLSEADAKRLSAAIETAPAGGFIGAVLFVFVLLLLTDILGVTKVFSFTRSARR